MNILFDTNIILDALLERDPFGENAIHLLNHVEHSNINGYLCADSVTTIFYLIEKCKTKAFAIKYIKLLLEIFEVAPINRSILEEAFELKFSDYEDAVIHQSAVGINADGIVTRNIKDFKKSKLTIYSPEELLAIIDSLKE